MALIADDARDRVEQLLLLTDRLTALVTDETRRIAAREDLKASETDEKSRLANAYRLELARIKQDNSLVEGAPPAMLQKLKANTVKLHEALGEHEIELAAVKLIAEGMVHAMAEEVVRQQKGERGYGARGVIETSSGPAPTVLDRNA